MKPLGGFTAIPLVSAEGGPDNMVASNALHPDFSSYVRYVEDVVTEALSSAEFYGESAWAPELLDGQAAQKLRDSVPLYVRKQLGAFFTSSPLRAAALAPKPRAMGLRSTVLDPAMGAGDLLIEVASQMPIVGSLIDTLGLWGSMLHGRDLEPEFVRLAKARLVLLAMSRGASATSDARIGWDEILPGIRVGDGLQALDGTHAWGHIVMNPPFTYHSAPPEARWSSGRTNVAATFLAKAVECARAGTQVTAILPDVIRTGSRYEPLRAFVGNRIRSATVEVFGQFDAWTDVDVFILKGVVGSGSLQHSTVGWWQRPGGQKVGDKFHVRVGTVVPHRDDETKPKRRYLHARAIPLGGEFNVSRSEKRGFQKRSFQPPFVVIRRTSRPGDRSRGKGTLIYGTDEALVENHLIVLLPKDGSISTCRDAICAFNSDQARQWLDDRIRCRHLTVGAVSGMPWFWP